MKELQSPQRNLLSEVCTVAKLILVMPATNAESRRVFSGLKRVKTYLRSTMGQQILNHLMLYSQKDMVDELDLTAVAEEFVSSSEHRRRTFGKLEEK